MWNLSKGLDFLPGTSLAKLKELYSAEKKAKPKMRLLCAIHRKQGESLDDIVFSTSMKRRTVHEILTRFCDRGITGKESIKQSGRPAMLTLKQRKALVKILEKGPARNESGLWTTKEVKEVIRKKFGVTYTNQHTWELLKAGGFSIQRPRQRHYKAASKQQIAAFKKRLAGWRAITTKKGL